MTKHQNEPLEIVDFNFDYTSDSIIKFISNKSSNFSCAGLDKDKLIALINFLAQKTEDSFAVEYHTNDGVPLYITHSLPSTKLYWFNQKAKESTGHTLSLTLDKELIKIVSNLSDELGILKGQLFLLILFYEYKPDGVFGSSHTNFFKAIADIKEFKLFNDETKLPYGLSDQNNNLFLGIEPTSTQKLTASQTKLLKDLHQDIPGTEKLPFSQLKPQILDICNTKFESTPVTKLRYVIKKAFEAQSTREYEEYSYHIQAIGLDGQVLRSDYVPIRFSLDDLEAMYQQNMEYYQSTYLLHVKNTLTEKELIFLPTLHDKAKSSSIFLMNISIQFENWLDFYAGKSNRTRVSFFRQALNNNLHLLEAHLKEYKADSSNDWSDVLKGVEVFQASISD
ncbi:hypothetical protein HLH17_02190 [Acinetobacter sp. ANC 5380]|uniref:Uncharacterized protein n=1 Tax=Acinetobacter terrae TaxID=2731247 RepID=A0A7Y2RDP8_9GAMM|nr:hypothetical protein [Acinetobacter terrae]NNH76511.1 hypothetical protein [Acinetobacter terrae]